MLHMTCMRIATHRLLCVTLGLALAGTAGCSLENVDGGGGDPSLPDRIPNSDNPAEDERLDLLGIQCESTLIVTGTWEETTPQPVDSFGCWSVGIWTVNVTYDRIGCDPQPEMVQQFTYEVTKDDEENSIITWLNDPENERIHFKITTSGDSLCHGGFEHYLPDNHLITLRPNKAMDGTLAGDGEYSVYLEDPWWKD